MQHPAREGHVVKGRLLLEKFFDVVGVTWMMTAMMRRDANEQCR